MTPARAEDTVRVGQLDIAISGIDASAARALGESVARAIANRLAASEQTGTLMLGALDLRLRLRPSEIGAERVATMVVAAIEERTS